MVAITKLRRFQGKTLAARPYTDELLAMLARLAPLAAEEGLRHPLFRAPEKGGKGKVVVLLVTSDRGYCGSYNTKIFEALHALLDARPGEEPVLHVVGRKGYAYLARRGHAVARYFAEPPLERLDFRAARLIARELVGGFLGGSYAALEVLSTRFVSMVSQRPARLPLLPV